MRGYLVYTWNIVETKYFQPVNGITTPDEIQAYEENKKSRYAIFSVLSKIELTKVIYLNTTYEVYKKMKDIYEGNERVNLTKRLVQVSEDMKT